MSATVLGRSALGRYALGYALPYTPPVAGPVLELRGELAWQAATESAVAVQPATTASVLYEPATLSLVRSP